jgi:hypothetical protein
MMIYIRLDVSQFRLMLLQHLLQGLGGSGLRSSRLSSESKELSTC